ncbi:MAG: alpha/beta fold hydrolase [Ramlibacter sp.]|nr:alpha/beta fold hydrolase [Ramlibacter sp.]
MTSLVPFVREAGSGPSVVCIHSNASSSAQWRGLIDLLAATRRVLAPDLFGSGKSPDWHSDREVSLRDEAAFIEPVLRLAGAPFDLIGHSHGGAVALISALADPRRVRAMVLYEPTLFAVVDERSPSPNGADGIRQAVVAASSALDRGDKDAAARYFIDFWMGAGSWDATPTQRKPAIADSVVNVRRWAHALFNETTPASAFAALDFPILYMLGEVSPRPAHAVADVLIPHLPCVKVVRLAGLGHMGPITHPEQVNAEIEQFLSEV